MERGFGPCGHPVMFHVFSGHDTRSGAVAQNHSQNVQCATQGLRLAVYNFSANIALDQFYFICYRTSQVILRSFRSAAASLPHFSFSPWQISIKSRGTHRFRNPPLLYAMANLCTLSHLESTLIEMRQKCIFNYL